MELPTHRSSESGRLDFINTRLEEPSGNNPKGLFDYKIGNLKYTKEGAIEKIPFTIKS